MSMIYFDVSTINIISTWWHYRADSKLIILEPGACNCPKNERCCSDGSTCVSIERFCDGIIDCDDRSDEQEEYCGCSLLDSFLCSSGKCIDKYLQCNNVNDCDDGEDEKFCEEEQICPKNQLRNRLFTKNWPLWAAHLRSKSDQIISRPENLRKRKIFHLVFPVLKIYPIPMRT